jgi:hypothetical protein
MTEMRVVKAESRSIFEKKVNQLLSEGWSLHGEMSVTTEEEITKDSPYDHPEGSLGQRDAQRWYDRYGEWRHMVNNKTVYTQSLIKHSE